ncbi:hypothetical protein H0H93_015310 [Arthromyces matolae]|nr:hypothetical protein H0H93_015310 [Arthromyces matolae]
MGFDAIWISPVVENVEETTAYGEAYHGYWGQNIHNLNSHFGTPEDLKELSTALHARGMYLMLDVVVNHMVTVPKHDPSGAVTFDYTTITSFPAESAFHQFCLISDYNNQTDVEQCWLGDEKLPLADLDTENESVVQTLNGWVKDLVQFYNVNGIRIDTAKHVRKDFWPDFLKSARVFSMAEVRQSFSHSFLSSREFPIGLER